MGRGLGFSGAARIGRSGGRPRAAVRAALSSLADVAADILALATELEGHADNVAASLHGGVVATAGGRAVRVPLGRRAGRRGVGAVVHHLDRAVAHRRCRPVVAFADAVFNVGRTALLVAALAAGDVDALRTATEDRLHQDARFGRSLPSHEALAAAPCDAGAWCGWLSGSGPSVAALCEPGRRRGRVAALPGRGPVQVLRSTDGAVVLTG